MTGKWPENEIDHVNCDRADDRWINLREATRSQNCSNKRRSSTPNTLGYRGVKRVYSKFGATVCVGQAEYNCGPYDTIEMAALAYDIAAKKHHGKFARFNFPEKMHRDWLLP